MTRRLGLAALGDLPEGVGPRVDPRGLDIGVVHLGVGAFHRAHQAVYTEDAVAAAGGDWGICGVSQRSRTVVDQLKPQDGLYTLAQVDGGGEQLRVMGSIRELRFARADPAGLVERIAAPAVRVITLTVSEKGYHHDPATNRLRGDSPEVAADLADGGTRTVLGQLAQGLERRRTAGAGAVTVVCCDNLPGNGAFLRGLVGEFAGRLPGGDSLLAWIEAHVRFPSTMVDRIVPATTAEDHARVAGSLGVRDEGVVVAEPFTQWVIEDDFAAPRPAWERAGAQLTADVRPYEVIKLRLLNGSHLTMAHLGRLAGCELVSDAMGPFEGVLRGLMDLDAGPTLTLPDGFDLPAYRDQLLRRFGNPALRHRTEQVAMDGTQKLPMRLLDTIAERRRAGAEPAFATLGVAAWMRAVSARRADDGRELTIDDPLADELARVVGGRDEPSAIVDALLGVRQVFGEELAGDARWREMLTEDVDALARDGAVQTARRLTR